MNDATFARLVEECAARHRTPESTVEHPVGVIVPDDPFMTEKLKEKNYVPYCMGTGCGRTRRTEFGFQCPTCGNKMNYDLTHYNGNIEVQYEGKPLSIAAWNAEVNRKKAQKARKKKT